MVVGVITNGVTAPNITLYNITSSGTAKLAGYFGKNVWDYGGDYAPDRY